MTEPTRQDVAPLRIDPESVHVLLTRTVPGHEAEAAQHLKRAISASSMRVFFGLGEYDLISVVQGAAARTGLLSSGTIPRFLGTREVVCFGVRATEAVSAPHVLERLDAGPIVVFSFVRLPGIFGKRDGPRHPEDAFIGWWRSTGLAATEPNTVLLETLGGPEFLIIHSCRSISEAYTWLAGLRPPAGLVSKILSLVAITDSVLSPTVGSSAIPLPLGAWAGKLALEIRVASRAEHFPVLARELPQHVAAAAPSLARSLRVSFVPGADDIVLWAELDDTVDLIDIIRALLSFRQDAGPLLIRTTTVIHDLASASTVLEETGLASAVDAQRQGRVPISLDLDAATASEILADPDVGPIAIRALYAFGNLLRDEVHRSDLFDMFAYFVSLREEARRLNTMTVRERLRFGARFPPAHLGVAQRTTGAHTGINTVESNVRHMVGGLTRLIQAAEAIPVSIFRQLGSIWPGFIIIGSRSEYWANDYQVIGLPPKVMWDPSQWDGLPHESIHCLVEARGTEFSLQEGSQFRAVFAELTKEVKGARIRASQDDLYDAVLETVVDLIQLGFGTWWAPELQIRCLWRYVESTGFFSEMGVADASWLAARAAVIWIAGSEWMEAGKHRRPAIAGHLTKLEETYRGWGVLGEKVMQLHGRLGRRRLVAHTKVLLAVRRYVTAVVPCEVDQMQRRLTWWRGEADAVVDRIGRAEAVGPEEVRYPELMVWKLAERFESGMEVGPRVAAILSLQASFRADMLYHRDEVLREVEQAPTRV